MTPFFAQMPSPDIITSNAEKYGIIGVLAVFIFLLIGVIYYQNKGNERRDKEIADLRDKAIAERDKAIEERDKRIEAERQAGQKYAEKLEAIHASRAQEISNYIEIAKSNERALSTLTATIERDQRSRP